LSPSNICVSYGPEDFYVYPIYFRYSIHNFKLRVSLSSIFVKDQAKALEFYTEKLGFCKKQDVDLGEYKWLTVCDAENKGVELLLEPNAHEASKAYQAAIYADGLPAQILAVDDLNAEYERLKKAGVHFTKEPFDAGTVLVAILDDTCGNLIQLVQEK